MEIKKRRSIWRYVRWPLALGLLLIGFIYFMMSAVGIIGYYGTTSLRMVKTAAWDNFKSTYFGAVERGKPYEFVGAKNTPRTASDGTVYFDSRLIDMLSYLAKGPANTANCPGWTNFRNPKHDKIKLDISYGTTDSDLYTQADNPPSVSTIYRGVGVRIAGADKIKCTVFYPNPDPHVGCNDPIPMRFYEFDILFDENEGFLSPRTGPPRPPGVCKIECAVNRFPDQPRRDVRQEEWNVDQEISAERPRPYSPLNPGIFQYEELTSKARQAAVYKETQIAYAIMSIDKEGCYTDEGLKGYQKLIPFSMIFPEWMYQNLKTASAQGGGTVWDDLTNIARNKDTVTGKTQERGGYLANWQDRSPLAGISWDPETEDRFGTRISPARSSPLEILHVNY